MSWFDAARFTNWLHNGQGSGDTETGAYTLNGATSCTAPAKNVVATKWYAYAKWVLERVVGPGGLAPP